MSDLKQRLLTDHAELEQQLRALARSVEANDAACDLCQCWTCFESALRDHLDTEERAIFPVVASAHRKEVEALRAEHQLIRKALAELGLAVELHTLRKAAVDELIVFLNQHAARENHTLYDWLVQSSGPSPQRRLLAMFDRRNKSGPSPRASEPSASR
jgi:hemerythrin-like domain-containing protein